MTPKLRLDFCVSGAKIQPIDFSQLLDWDTYRSWEKGDIFSENRKRDHACWIASTGYIDTYDLDDLVAIVKDKIEGKINDLEKVVVENNLLATLEVVVKASPNEMPGLSFSGAFLSLLSRMNCSVDIDLYCNESEDAAEVMK